MASSTVSQMNAAEGRCVSSRTSAFSASGERPPSRPTFASSLPRIRIYAIERAGLLIRQGHQDVGAVSPLGHWYVVPLPTIRRPWLYLLMLQIVGHYPVPLLPTMWILCAGLIAKVTRVHVQKRPVILPTAFDSLVLHDATYDQWICALFVLPGF